MYYTATVSVHVYPLQEIDIQARHRDHVLHSNITYAIQIICPPSLTHSDHSFVNRKHSRVNGC